MQIIYIFSNDNVVDHYERDDHNHAFNVDQKLKIVLMLQVIK